MAIFQTIKLTESKQQTKVMGDIEKVKCLIIGSGPAGFTAAIYAARANLSPVVIEGLEPGGQLTTTTEVDNFPGYPEGITGPIMMEDLKKQAIRFGTDVRFGYVSSVDLSQRPFKVVVDGEKLIEAQALIIATGATAKYMGLESEDQACLHVLPAMVSFIKGRM
jgi:thioredoxin reductase (NADPH)